MALKPTRNKAHKLTEASKSLPVLPMLNHFALDIYVRNAIPGTDFSALFRERNNSSSEDLLRYDSGHLNHHSLVHHLRCVQRYT